MIKRLWWFAMGFVSGIVATVYSWHWVRRTVRRYVPEQVRSDVADGLRNGADSWRHLGGELRAAIAEGRAQAAATEAQLRADYGPSRTPARDENAVR